MHSPESFDPISAITLESRNLVGQGRAASTKQISHLYGSLRTLSLTFVALGLRTLKMIVSDAGVFLCGSFPQTYLSLEKGCRVRAAAMHAARARELLQSRLIIHSDCGFAVFSRCGFYFLYQEFGTPEVDTASMRAARQKNMAQSNPRVTTDGCAASQDPI